MTTRLVSIWAYALRIPQRAIQSIVGMPGRRRTDAGADLDQAPRLTCCLIMLPNMNSRERFSADSAKRLPYSSDMAKVSAMGQCLDFPAITRYSNSIRYKRAKLSQQRKRETPVTQSVNQKEKRRV